MVTKTPESTYSTMTSLHGLTIILLLLSLIANVISVMLLSGTSVPFLSATSREDSIKNTLLTFEYEKVGGQENYEILQKYSQMQIAGQIDQIKEYVKNPQAQPTAQTPAAKADAGPMSPEDVKKIVDDAAIEGNKQASILVVEYSDMECPFCMKQYHDTKLFPSLLGQYKDQVAVAFKNNRGVDHKGTEAKAIGTLCAGAVGGDAAYQKFYKGIMDKSTNEGGVLDVAALPEVAKSIGLDVAKWQSCVDKKETLAKFTGQTQEAQKYGLGGTPGTLILNVKTGKYKTVEGAYPYATFTAAIDELLK